MRNDCFPIYYWGTTATNPGNGPGRKPFFFFFFFFFYFPQQDRGDEDALTTRADSAARDLRSGTPRAQTSTHGKYHERWIVLLVAVSVRFTGRLARSAGRLLSSRRPLPRLAAPRLVASAERQRVNGQVHILEKKKRNRHLCINRRYGSVDIQPKWTRTEFRVPSVLQIAPARFCFARGPCPDLLVNDQKKIKGSVHIFKIISIEMKFTQPHVFKGRLHYNSRPQLK